MKMRFNTLWRVPVFCIVSSIISFYLTVYIGGFFFVVQTVGADGTISVSADPVRSAVFHGVIFVAILLLGGLWAFRGMTKGEITVSAAIISAVYLAIVLAQLCLPSLMASVSLELAVIQNWPAIAASLLIKLTGNFELSCLVSAFAPLLFIPFGKKTAA